MKTGFFITARLKSTRLPKKILLDLNGKPVIDRIIERTKEVKGLDGIVLCTSDHPQDTELVPFAQKNGIDSFRGSQDDVLKRLLDAAKYYGFDAFLSITADNPLFSISASQQILDIYKKQHHDFIYTNGLPIGCGTYVIDAKALEVVNYIKNESNTEIWGPFINRPDFFNVAELKLLDSPIPETQRITLDYPEDYKFIKALYQFYQPDEIPMLKNILTILSEKHELIEINRHHKQAYLDQNKLDQISHHFEKIKRDAAEFAQERQISIKAGYTEYSAKI